MRARVVLAGLAALVVLGGSPAGTWAETEQRDGNAATTPARTGDVATTPARTGGAEVAQRVVWPVAGRVLEGFDPPASPYGAGHRGVKLDAPAGASVAAAMPGRVSFAGDVAGTRWVTVAHGSGLDTTYGPVDAGVDPGAAVQAGETLGQLSSGATSLHWGARLDGDYLDPLSLFARWEVHLVAPRR